MIEIKGLEEFNAKLKELSKIAEDTMQEELEDIAMDLASKSSNSAPVLYGDLRGELATPKRDGKGWKIGSSLPYTAKQHEHTEFNHPRGGGAKFIEKPFRQNVDKYIKEIGKAIESELK